MNFNLQTTNIHRNFISIQFLSRINPPNAKGRNTICLTKVKGKKGTYERTSIDPIYTVLIFLKLVLYKQTQFSWEVDKESDFWRRNKHKGD